MPISAARTVRRYLARGSSCALLGDAALLARHLAGDHEAFAELVRRHGPMVLGVCRRALGPGPDADDAFQAVFVALARHARQVRGRDDLGAWLHRVAVHAAARARARRARAEPAELPEVPGPPADPLADVSWREVRRMLDEELNRLPPRLRGPLVACYLDGQTRDEAARRLGCSVSTLKRRLRRGLHVLRARLTGRGIAPIALAAGALTGDGLRAVVPDPLVRRTAQTATERAADIPAPLVELIPEVVRSGIGVPAAALAAVAAGVVAMVCLSPPTRADRPPPANPPVAASPNRPPADSGANDPLPAGAAARFGFPRFRTGALTHAELSPDGKWLAAMSPGGVLVWDMASGRFVGRVPSRARDLGAPDLIPYCFTAEGDALVVQSGPSLGVWDITGGSPVLRSPPAARAPPPGRTNTLPVIQAITRTSGPEAVYAYTSSGTVFTVELGPGLSAITRNSGSLVAVRPGGWEASLEKGGMVRLRRDGGGPGIRTLSTGNKFGKSTLTRLTTDPDRRYVFTAEDGLARVWQPDRADEFVHIIALPAGQAAKALVSTPDGKTLFIGLSDGRIARHALPAGKPLAVWPAHEPGPVTELLLTADGKRLVSLGGDHVIRRWDVDTGAELPPPDGYARRVRAAFSPDGTQVAVADAAGRVDVWEVNSRGRRTLRTNGPTVRALHWPDARSLAAFQEPDTLTVWDPRTGREVRSVVLHGRAAPAAAEHWFPGVALSPDGRRAVRALDQGGTWCYDTQTGRPIWRHPGTGDAVFSPDGNLVAVGRPSDGFRLIDVATGRVERTIPLHAGTTRAADRHQWSFTADGRALMVTAGGPDVLERGLHPVRGLALLPAESWQGAIVSAVSPDGRWLARGDETGTVTLIETASGKLARQVAAHLGSVAELAFRPDGRRLLSVGRDLTVLLWNVRVPVAGSAEPTEQVWARARLDPDFFPALFALADRPNAVDLLRAKFRPAVGPPPEEIARALFHLDSDRYAVREPAFNRLSEWGPLAESAMRHALTRGWSDDTIRRLETILETLPRPLTEEEIAQTRAVFVLETMNTPAARQLLEEWSTGAGGARLTEEARKALKRLYAP